MTRRLAWLLLSVLLLAAWACNSRPTAQVPTTAATTVTEDDLQGPNLFEEVAASSGLDFTYRNGEDVSPHLSILEALGGGVALIDYDGDGLLDVFVTGGGFFDGPDKKQIKGYPSRLYKNLGNFKFKDVTKEAGLDHPLFYTHGVAVADFDCDGW